jgi:hypothetical protein
MKFSAKLKVSASKSATSPSCKTLATRRKQRQQHCIKYSFVNGRRNDIRKLKIIHIFDHQKGKS